ncbi:MAG: hypothetical protein WCY93_11070 [Anaerolineaceae bacterium]
MSNRNAYEIRLDTLHLAQKILQDNMSLMKAPYTEADLLRTANQLYDFVKTNTMSGTTSKGDRTRS